MSNEVEGEEDEYEVCVLCSLPSAASRSPSEFPLTAQTDLSHSSPGQWHGDHGDDDLDYDYYDLDDDAFDNLNSDAFDDLDEYFSTEEMRRACLLSPVSNPCPDLREISIALLWQHFVMNPVLHDVWFHLIPPRHWLRQGSSSGCSLSQKSPLERKSFNLSLKSVSPPKKI